MKYQTIIVDNELPHIRNLKRLLTDNFASYQIVAECTNVADGITAIKKLNPDLIFLDIEMPPQTGFDLLQAFTPPFFETIFTTSHQEYALQAIKFSALDYLLKPFDEIDLRNALNRFETKQSKDLLHMQYENLFYNIKRQNSRQQRITLASANGMDFYQVEEIIRCESDNVYTTFFLTENRQVVVSKSMREWETLLEPFNFCRVHNQHLINLSHLKKYIKGEGGIAIMSDGKEVDVSRRKKEFFINKISNL